MLSLIDFLKLISTIFVLN